MVDLSGELLFMLEIYRGMDRARSKPELLDTACRIAVEHTGFRLVRAIPLESDFEAQVGGMHFGPAAGLVARQQAECHLAGTDEVEIWRMLLATENKYCSTDLGADPLLSEWAPACAEFGIGALAALPLHIGGRIGYAMAFYAADGDSLDPAMIDLLEKLAFDISLGLERLSIARRVRDSELRFASVFRFNPNCILITRLADNRIVDANDAFLDTFDYGLDEVIGRHTTDIPLWNDPADHTAAFECLERTGRVKDFETQLRRRSGDLLDCVVTVEIIAVAGERHLVCIVTDVTERIRAERRLHAREQEFRALAENSPDIISRFDRDCRRVYVNPEMGRAFNLDTKKLLGKTPTEAMPESRLAMQVQETLAQVLASATQRELEVEENNVPERPPVHRHLRFVPEFDAEGRVNSVLVIGRDISRLKESESRLKETQAQLRELAARREAARDEERKTMAREVHDVLGQLLTALRLDIAMMGMDFGAGEPLLLHRVAKSMELVDGTIAIVRGLATALRPSALDMGIASALAWQIKDFERRTGVRCALSVEIGNDELDEFQAMAVFRLVQESLTNVARHAQARCVTVALDKTRGSYNLTIVDDGVGFEPTEARRGSLGLVGMRERVMGLGGELEIASAPDEGTRIEVRFPVKNTNGVMS